MAESTSQITLAQSALAVWIDTLKIQSPDEMIKLYHEDGGGVLLPIVSPIIRANKNDIRDYFVGFLSKNPTVLQTYDVHSYSDKDGCHTISGNYDFKLQATGDIIKARFTFVFKEQHNGGYPLIMCHHSSAQPDAHLPHLCSDGFIY